MKRTMPVVRKQPDLEWEFHNAVRMAHIATILLDGSLSDQATQRSVTGRPDTYYIPNDTAESILFAAYEVQNLISQLREKYLSAR